MTTTTNANAILQREVLCCVSGLVSTLASSDYPHGADDLGALMDQAMELAAPIDDWETAAREAGWEHHDIGIMRRPTKADEIGDWQPDGGPTYLLADASDWEDACVYDNLLPYKREVRDHWAVSAWLANRLKALGERVDRDFVGLNVWARSTSDPVSMDSAIVRIHAALVAALMGVEG